MKSLVIRRDILAKEIMDRNFLIIDSSLPLINCIRKMNKNHKACLVVKEGNFLGILSKEDILKWLLQGKDKNISINALKIRKKFVVISPETNVLETLLLMKKNNVDFIVVKDEKNFQGLITKKEIAESEPFLFENIERM